MPGTALNSLSDVSETLLIPLYARAMEAQRPDAIVRDERAVALVAQLDYDFSRIKLQDHDWVGILLRLREFDRFTRDFLARFPQGVVVHAGCGLDTRFERVDNGEVEWYDLDLPEVADLRRALIGEGGRNHLLGCSVLDSAWLDRVSVHAGRPFLFVAEALLPYLSETEVRSLVLVLRERFPGAELVCDAMTPLMVWMHNLEFVFSRLGARLHWGLKRGRDLECWAGGIRLLDEWFYFDRPEPRLGTSQWMRHIPALGRGTGVFHYRLGQPLAGEQGPAAVQARDS